jgi:hypothetical protein
LTKLSRIAKSYLRLRVSLLLSKEKVCQIVLGRLDHVWVNIRGMNLSYSTLRGFYENGTKSGKWIHYHSCSISKSKREHHLRKFWWEHPYFHIPSLPRIASRISINILNENSSCQPLRISRRQKEEFRLCGDQSFFFYHRTYEILIVFVYKSDIERGVSLSSRTNIFLES